MSSFQWSPIQSGGASVTTLNGLSGVLTLAGGTGITITDNGSDTITISSHAAVTLAAVGSSPNANAATLSGQALNLEPASASFPGVITTGVQSFAGNKTFTGTIAASNFSGTSSGTNTGDVTLAAVGSSPNANSASLSGQALTLQPADGTNPGVVTAGVQTFGGNKTFTGAIAASNFSGSSSGTNTGDVTLAAVGSSPNANGASLSGQALTLQPADGTNPGALSAGTQTVGGVKTFSSNPIMSGLTASQAVVTDGSKALASLAYASANTASALVQRDGSGNFSAGTITASVTGTASGNTTISSQTNFGVVLASATNAMTSTGAGAAGQILRSGGAGVAPDYSAATYPSTVAALSVLAANSSNVVTTISGVTANRLLRTDGNNIAFDRASLTTDVTGTLPVANGGTGAASLTVHGVVIGNSTSAVSVTAAGSAGQILQSGGASADPTYSTATYPSTTTANRILYSSANDVVGQITSANTSALVTNSSGVPSLTSGGVANRLLRTDGTTVTFAQAALTTDVSGVLPIANGGTNNGSLAVTAGGVVYTDGSKLVNTGAGTTGQVLTSAGASPPTWAASPWANAVTAMATRGTTQAISDSTTTTVIFATESVDTDTAYDTTTGIFTVPTGKGGMYLVASMVEFAASATGVRSLDVAVSGSGSQGAVALDFAPALSGVVNAYLTGSTVVKVPAAGTIKVTVFQNSGGSLNIGVSGGTYNYISISYLGAA